MTTTLFTTGLRPPRGVVLVGHGLNTRPDAMTGLVDVLVDAGFHCLRIGFLRDDPPRRVVPSEVAADWLAAFTAAHAEARKRFPGLPVHVVGYSLGALVPVVALDTDPTLVVDRMVLVAPAVALTRLASTVRLLTPLARTGAGLPSAAPRHVRARARTPLAEYAALLELVGRARTLGDPARLDAIPTTVVLDRRDELVGHRAVTAWLARNGLTGWRTTEVTGRARPRGTSPHLLVVEEALGARAWQRLADDVVAGLDGSR